MISQQTSENDQNISNFQVGDLCELLDSYTILRTIVTEDFERKKKCIEILSLRNHNVGKPTL